MIFAKFTSEVKDALENYLKYISDMQTKGCIDSNGGTILYPNILIVTNCSGYYVAELVGAVNKYNGLTLKIHKEKSIYRYFSQFDDSAPVPGILIEGENSGFINLCLARPHEIAVVKKRFPSIELFKTTMVFNNGKGCLISFAKDFESTSFNNCILINRMENLYRCKNILSAYIFKSSITSLKLIDSINHSLSGNEVRGIHGINSKNEEQLTVAGQLQSMYLLPGLHETTIGEFLRLHPDIVRKAFKTEHFEYEPYLQWIEHDGTCKDVAINPDLLIKRVDGYYDIYDLKTAALAKTNVTKGGRKRRQFVSYIHDGISQLANYREYFTFPKNAELAKNKYGIQVKEPKLVLVVGSWENSSPEEVKQALRAYPDIEIIDYDTFCHLFIGINN